MAAVNISLLAPGILLVICTNGTLYWVGDLSLQTWGRLRCETT